jgi:hypothetical protein
MNGAHVTFLREYNWLRSLGVCVSVLVVALVSVF